MSQRETKKTKSLNVIAIMDKILEIQKDIR